VFLGIEIAKFVAERHYGFIPQNSRAYSKNNAWSFTTNLFLVQALGFHRETTFNGPGWSISVEFYTYLLFGLVVLCFSSRKRLSLAMVVLFASSLLLLCRFGGVGLTDTVGPSFFRCVAGFSLGVLVYQAHCAYQARIAQCSELLKFVLIGLVLVWLSVKEPGPSDYLALPAFAWIIAVVAAAPQAPLAIGLNATPLRWLGKVSYSIYMVHDAVIIFASRLAGFLTSRLHPSAAGGRFGAESMLGLGFVLLAVAAVLCLSHFTYNWIEAPGQRRARTLAREWFGA
jgi:peptidoglycan/LPS O-acetylase OafA/YrhL